MIPLSLHYERNSGKKTRLFLQILVLFLFLTAITAPVAANPISPEQGTEVPRQIQYSPASAGPVSSMEWTQATEHAQFADRRAHSTVVFDDSIWVIGGAVHPSPYFSDVWRSDDGITWTQVTRQAAFGQRAGHGSVVFDNKIWVIGGRDGNTKKPLNDVWYTTDGIAWTQAVGQRTFPPRYSFTTEFFNNRLWVIAGTSGNDVWYSEELPSLATISSQAPPGDQPAYLIVTRTISPSSIKAGTDTVITITVQNTDKLPVHDIEILDTPPDDFSVVDGITRFTIPSLGPDDTRSLTYTVRAKNAGTFRLNKTAVMYADGEGNYHLTYSDFTNVKVFPSLFEPVPEDPVDGCFQKINAWINGFNQFR